MKNILIPINFNTDSDNVICYALTLFEKEPCNFYFLNTYKYQEDSLNTAQLLKVNQGFPNVSKYNSEKNLSRLVKKYSTELNHINHSFNAISECGNLLGRVKNAISEFKIDLLIIPTTTSTSCNTEKYSRNAKSLIENIRECPVMVIPNSANYCNEANFVMVSNFEVDIPISELKNWYELVKIANGKIKIIAIAAKDGMSTMQKSNYNRVRYHLEMFAKDSVSTEYVENIFDLKRFANYHSDYIICLIDKKPNFLRMCGITNSEFFNLGPISNSPIISLHQ